MVPITHIAKLTADLLLIISTASDLTNLFNQDSLKEEVLKYEKLRRDAISRHKRKTCRCVVYKNPEQRSAVLSSTRSLLLLQNGINDAGEHRYTRPGQNTRQYVRNEPRLIGPRKRILNSDNGG